MTGTGNIALIYFSRSSNAEGRHKQWLGNDRSGRWNHALAASLVNHGLSIAKRSGLPVFHYHEGNQVGDTFGERISNAFFDVFQKGYGAVVAVGNDSPELEGIDWGNISGKLASGKNVLGPSTNGGAYIIGLTAASFHRDAFQQLPWQSGKLFKALLQFCPGSDASIHVLKKLRDINSFADILTLAGSKTLGNTFRKVLLFLLNRFRIHYIPFIITVNNLVTGFIKPLRAPPGVMGPVL